MSWRDANVSTGMVSQRDHIVFVRLLQPEVDQNSQHAGHSDIVDHAYTCAHRTPPIECEAIKLPSCFCLVCYKGNFCAIPSPSNPGARVMPCGLSRPPHSSAVTQGCEWLFSFILID